MFKYSFILFYFVCTNIFCQPRSLSVYDEGLALYWKGDIKAAIPLLKEGIKSIPDTLLLQICESNLFLARTYISIGEPGKGLPFLQKVFELDKNYTHLIEYYMGICAEDSMKYDLAIKYFKNFANTKKGKENSELLADVMGHIDKCKNLKIESRKKITNNKIIIPTVNKPAKPETQVSKLKKLIFNECDWHRIVWDWNMYTEYDQLVQVDLDIKTLIIGGSKINFTNIEFIRKGGVIYLGCYGYPCIHIKGDVQQLTKFLGLVFYDIEPAIKFHELVCKIFKINSPLKVQ